MKMRTYLAAGELGEVVREGVKIREVDGKGG